MPNLVMLFFPVQCLFAPKAQKGITKGKRSRGCLENVYTRFMSCVRVCVRVRARLQLTYVAMAKLRKRSQFMIE